MNLDAIPPDALDRFRHAAALLTQNANARASRLLTLKEDIAMLRSHGVSYRSISDLLTQNGIPTSDVSVMKFCHRFLNEKRSRKSSAIPPLGNDKSKVLTLNLRNRMIFRSADEADALQAADFLGKKRVFKRSWGSSAGKRNVNYSETEEHKIKPYQLRNLRDHECVLVHCEKGFRRMTLPPLEPDGRISKWFPWWKRLL